QQFARSRLVEQSDEGSALERRHDGQPVPLAIQRPIRSLPQLPRRRVTVDRNEQCRAQIMSRSKILDVPAMDDVEYTVREHQRTRPVPRTDLSSRDQLVAH